MSNIVVSPQTPRTPITDPHGRMPYEWIKFFQDTAQAINNALTILGQFDGQIGPNATVVGHVGTLADSIQHLSATGTLAATALTGIVPSAQLPPAQPTIQGAVVLPAGATSNTLGSAAFDNASAFDPAGAAATAQSNAETFATGKANTAQTNAESYTDGKFTGAVGHTVTLAKLTVGGSNGSLTFNSNGLLTAFVDPT